MKKRLMIGLLVGGLLTAMLPGVASAQPYGNAFAGTVKNCKAGGQQIAREAQNPFLAYGTRNFGQAARTYTPPKDGTVPMVNMASYCEPGPNAP